MIEERNQLQLELSELQSERDRLFEEKVHFQTSFLHSLHPPFKSSLCCFLTLTHHLPPPLLPPSLPPSPFSLPISHQVQLKGSLQELFSERRQLLQDMENTHSKCNRFENIARKLKEQNEVLCERVSVTLINSSKSNY